jgi:hypothetical protein
MSAMKTPSIVLPIALIAIASQAQIAPAPYLCKYEDVHNLMRQPTGDLRMQTSGFQFPAKIKVHPARGWFHGQDADFLNPGPGLEATSYPGTLRLAPVSTSTALSRDFESGLQGMTATGAFRVYSDLAFGYGSNRSARIECNSTGTGNINLINTQTDTAIYREFEMYYYADPDFPGFTLIAKVKIGLATTDVSLIDIRFDRGEDGAPSYNNEWRQLRLDINGLLAARGHPNAVITNLRITNSVTATGPKMWIDNMRMFGGAYPDFTDYLSPPRRMDQPYPFDTFYWSKSRTFWSPFAAVELGQSGTGLQFQIRSGPTRVECESAPWYGPTSDTDWYTTDDLLCGFQAINPVHNGDTWVQVRARLISSPDHLHTPVLEDFCVTWGDANTWDIMGLILKAVDADYQDANGVTQHETSSMTQADVDDLSNQWQFFIRYAPRFMSYNLKLRSELHVVHDRSERGLAALPAMGRHEQMGLYHVQLPMDQNRFPCVGTRLVRKLDSRQCDDEPDHLHRFLGPAS